MLMDEKKTMLILISLLLAVILAGCLQPRIITDLGLLNVSVAATDASAFISAGCIEKENGLLDCSAIGLEERFSCKYISVPDGLGGLSPHVPIVECTVLAENMSDEEGAGIVHKGCLQPLFRRYIIIENREYKLIENKEEFIRFFAPVETPEEALAFAIAMTNSYAAYNLTIPQGYDVFASTIRTTYVEKTNETDSGFKVHLFFYQSCGCGSHPHYAIDYLVTNSGDVKEISSEKMYENPKLKDLCID
jgi:hypothetical protein